jgi:hypothetical protein
MDARFRYWAGLLMAACLIPGAATSSSPCDPSLLDESGSPLAYRQRGDRCEGLYAQQVGALSLEIRSLIESFGAFDPQQDPELAVEWTAPPQGGGREVRLRAFSFQPRTYFRMDAALPAGSGSYRWPTDVLAAVGLGREDLGLVAWTTLPGPGGSARAVYLPLRLGPAAAPPARAEILVSLVPSVRLQEIRISLTRLDAEGGPGATLRQHEELGYGYYPSNKPTVFSLGGLGEAGLYGLKVTATATSGLSVDQAIEIYHRGD